MKKLVTLSVVGLALALSACASQKGDSDYGYERQAPYSDSRTVGAKEPVATAEPVFQARTAK